MDQAVSHIRMSCYLELRRIAHLRPLISEDAAKQLVLSFVISKLDYCNGLLFGITNKNIEKLQLIQNHAARLVKRASKYDSATSLLKELHWLPVSARVLYKTAVCAYRSINDTEYPAYMKNLISLHIPPRSLRSSSKSKLDVPDSRLKTYGDRAFSFAAPDVWNSLPESVKSAKSLDVFKTKLKTHLFELHL